MKKFGYEVVESKNNEQYIFKFENGFGASVIRRPETYGYREGLWELAVLDENGDIIYDTPITNDVVNYLTDDQVNYYLKKIENLRKKNILSREYKFHGWYIKCTGHEAGGVSFWVTLDRDSLTKGYHYYVHLDNSFSYDDDDSYYLPPGMTEDYLRGLAKRVREEVNEKNERKRGS